jgi:hypothetical protein
MHFTNSSSYHLGRLFINLQYPQKFLRGNPGGRGGEDIPKGIRKFSLIVSLRVYLGSKSFKLVKWKDENA